MCEECICDTCYRCEYASEEDKMLDGYEQEESCVE